MTKKTSVLLATSVAAILTNVAAPAVAGGLRVTNSVLVQAKSTASDGTTRVALVPASRAVPGDRIVYRVAYRNEVGAPISGVVVNNPVPADLAYRGPAEGSPAPEVSVDGKSFAPLATLLVAGRPARAEDVRAVRWQVKGTLPAGAAGQYAFEAIIK